jgi:hypothetical protein
VSGANDDDNVGRFGFVSLQTIRIGVAPVSEIYHFSRLDTRLTCLGSLGRLDDVESVEERVLSEQPAQLRNHSPSNWVRVRSTCADVNFIAHSLRLGWCRLGSYPTRHISHAAGLRWSNAMLSSVLPRKQT